VRYAPLVASGVLVILFSVEHVVALLDGNEVVPSWH
jgi:TRAP-type transport system small permease protein